MIHRILIRKPKRRIDSQSFLMKLKIGRIIAIVNNICVTCGHANAVGSHFIDEWTFSPINSFFFLFFVVVKCRRWWPLIAHMCMQCWGVYGQSLSSIRETRAFWCRFWSCTITQIRNVCDSEGISEWIVWKLNRYSCFSFGYRERSIINCNSNFLVQ